MKKKIKSCLISMFNKSGMDQLLEELKKLNIVIYATGGTYDYIDKSFGYDNMVKVENITDYPSILGGRVKTLHPKIFGGILNRRANDNDIADMEKYNIPQIDMVVVDLYPFEQTVENTDNEDEIIEKIDIGGVSLIRAAAKNYKDVLIVPSVSYLQDVVNTLKENDGVTGLDFRRKMACAAFDVTSHYDTAIFSYFNEDEKFDVLKLSFDTCNHLRYGENPHQTGTFYGNLSDVFSQLHGKEISFNNLVDIDSGLKLIAEFKDPAVAILKHTNACGMAERNNLLDAWNDALAGDPVSAFGGVIIVNKPIDDVKVADEINKIFFEVIIAPDFSTECFNVLCSKKNRIILRLNKNLISTVSFKSILNGVLVQDADFVTDDLADFDYVTDTKPTGKETEDLIFANILVKHTKSNAIVIAKNKQLIGSGTGQTSRVDALKQAVAKAKAFGFDLKGAVMASDAFFPFADCVEIAHNEGINAVIQPGGSIRDKDSIEYCNLNKMSMVFTGHRHFKH